MQPEQMWASEWNIWDDESTPGNRTDTEGLVRRAEKVIADSQEAIATTQRLLADTAARWPGLFRPRGTLPVGRRTHA
jgi:hypothetical protein